MKTKISKILGVGLALIMVLTMAGAFLPSKAEAALPAVSGNVWTQFGFPFPGAQGAFFRDVNIAARGPFVKAINGDLYVYVTYTVAPANRIFKSTNGGRTWVDLPNYFAQVGGGVVTDFAASSFDANTLYILANNLIYKTVNGGASFVQITAPVLAGAVFSCIDVGYSGGRHYIFVGNSTVAVSEHAWYLDDSVYGAPWIPMGVVLAVASPVYEIACSPNFTAEANPLVMAVVGRGGGGQVEVWNKYGTGAWNTTFAAILTLTTTAALPPLTKPYIAFPDNFDSNPLGPSFEYWVSINDGAANANGGLFQVFYGGPAALPLAAVATGVADFTSVDVDGPAYAAAIMGGSTLGNVTRSLDDGVTWLGAQKPPTGNGPTWVLMDEDYTANGQALALVNGANAALSRQVADRCWNQISLIDTDTAAYNSVAFSDDVANDGNIFLVSSQATTAGQSFTLPTAADAVTLTFATAATGWYAITSGTVTITVVGTGAFTVVSGVNPGLSTGTWATPVAVDAVTFTFATASTGVFTIDTGTVTVTTVPAATVNPTNSLWKNDGTYWERVASSVSAAGIGEVQTSPAYSTDATVYYTDIAKTALLRSPNGSAIFIPLTNNPAAPFFGWKVLDSLKVIAGYANTAAVTINRGASAWAPFTTGLVGIPQSFALSPDFVYGTSGQIVTGTTVGTALVSSDFCQTWIQLPAGLPAGSTVYPTFADDYDSTVTGGYIYASTSVAAVNGVYRCQWTVPAPWTRIDNSQGAPAAGAAVPVAAVPADAFSVTCVAGGVFTLTVPTGVVAVTVLAGAPTIAYNPATVAYTITMLAAAAVTVTAITAPVAGILATAAAVTGTVALVNDADGDMTYPLGAIGGGAAASYTVQMPDAAVAATTAPGAAAFTVSTSTGIVLKDGTLYAVDTAAAEGMSRCLNPTANVLAVPPLQPYFERINNFTGGPFTVHTLGLGIASGMGIQATADSTSLWAIDNSAAGPTLWQYDDTLVKGPALTLPASAANVPEQTWTPLGWETLTAAQQWDIQYDTSPTFAFAPTIVNSNLASSLLTGLISGTTYYWRTRVTTQLPCRSNWSDTFSFSTAMGPSAWTPGTVPQGTAPSPGATNVGLVPAFMWVASSGATSYHFMLDDNSDFGSTIVDTSVVPPVYDNGPTLAYGTTYYWQVNAVSASGAVSHVFTSTFTTLVEPVAGVFTCPLDGLTFDTQAELEAHNAAAHAPVTPMYIWIVIAIGAILVIAVIWLIFTTRRA